MGRSQPERPLNATANLLSINELASHFHPRKLSRAENNVYF
jgi:hypothetical protein